MRITYNTLLYDAAFRMGAHLVRSLGRGQPKGTLARIYISWLVVSTHLKNMLSNWIISPGKGETQKYLKPPPSIRFCQVNSLEVQQFAFFEVYHPPKVKDLVVKTIIFSRGELLVSGRASIWHFGGGFGVGLLKSVPQKITAKAKLPLETHL